MYERVNFDSGCMNDQEVLSLFVLLFENGLKSEGFYFYFSVKKQYFLLEVGVKNLLMNVRMKNEKSEEKVNDVKIVEVFQQVRIGLSMYGLF